MTVYVDNARISFGRLHMSHMTADTTEELHEFARKLGLKPEWFQDHRVKHYDLSESKRNHAIKHGAIPLSMREFIAKCRDISYRKDDS